jgi:hypothetical protein
MQPKTKKKSVLLHLLLFLGGKKWEEETHVGVRDPTKSRVGFKRGERRFVYVFH